MKKNIAKVIAFLAGLYFLLEFMLPAKAPGWLGGFENPFTSCYITVTNFLMVLGAMAFYLGPINLTRSEAKQIIHRRKGWAESAAYLVALLIGILATALRSDDPNSPDVMTMTYNAIFYGIGLSFYITSMGLVSFYLVSAAHRAFLLNSRESGLMMISASIVMLGLTPAGDLLDQYMPNWFQVGATAQWIMGCPNTAVQKAVLFGACGGAFVAAMRNWLSLGKSGE